MRLSRVLPVLALAASLVFAGCIKEDPLAEAATNEMDPDGNPTPTNVTPTPPTHPSSSPPASPPPTTPTSSAAANTSAPPAPAAPRVDVFVWNGSITGAGAAASTPGPAICCVSVAPAKENADADFDVPGLLKGIVVELVWTDAAFDLDLLVTAPDYDELTPAPPEPYSGHRWLAGEGTPGQPDARASIVLTDEAALALTGTWASHVSAKGPANAVPFTVYVSLFYDEAPSGDYTAAASV